MDVERLEENLKLLEEKIVALDAAWIVETDASVKFKLKNEIKELQQKREELNRAISEKCGIGSPAGTATLREKVAQLAFSRNMGLLDRLNCNRNEMIEKFWGHFDEAPASGFQYYFVSSCPTQMPHCFSERAIIELLEEIEDELGAIHIRRHGEDERLLFFDLPAGRNLARSQQEFGKFFARYFEQQNDKGVGPLFSKALLSKRYEYAAIIFRLFEREWKKSHPDYFQWIIDTLSGLNISGLRFLFFFVNYVEGLHQGQLREEQRNIINTFEQLARDNPAAFHLSPLPPVVEIDLKTWLQRLGETNPAKVEAVIKAFVKGLPPEARKQYEQGKLLNMCDIDLLQEVVFQVANE